MTSGKTDWERLRDMSDEEIEQNILDDLDAAPILDATFWENAQVVTPPDRGSHPLLFDVSDRVLDFFRKDGQGVQGRINAVLEAYVDSQTNRSA